MKNILIFFCFIVTTPGDAQLREVDGKLYNPSQSKQWSFFEGEVLAFRTNLIIARQVTKKDHYRMRPVSRLQSIGGGGGGDARVFDYEETIYGQKVILRNFQGAAQVGQQITARSMEVGVTNIQGESLPVRDCGRDASSEMIAARRAEVEVTLDNQKRTAAEIKAKQNTEAEKKVIAYQFLQASNGYPSCQLDLGIRYANGKGVPRNLELSRHWLNAAMTNGSIEASNAFKKLFPP